MLKKLFTSFREASNYAKEYAQNIGASVKLEREGISWAVISNKIVGSKAIKPDRQEEILEEWRRSQAEEREHCALIKESREAERLERDARNAYLEKRRKHYDSLTEKKLMEQWSMRDESEIESDELALLRNTIRGVKGITPIYSDLAQVCRQCGMVGENCTCGRSWF